MLSKDVLNLKPHDEGNYDVDRLDYILRDALYSGEMLLDYSHEQYTRVFAKLDKDGNIMKNEDGSIVLVSNEAISEEPKKENDVYDNYSITAIEKFLEKRVQAYKNIYFSKTIQVQDSLVGVFVNDVLNNTSDNAGKDLKEFIKNIKEKDIDLDLEEYLKWDDIRFFTNCFEIAENSNNKDLRDFSGMIIPNIKSLMNLTFSHLNLRNARENNYATLRQEDKDFVHKIKDIIYSDTGVSQMLKDEEYYKKNRFICVDEEKISELKERFGDTILYSEATVYGYKKSIPIYIKDKTGKVFMLHEHPEKSCDWEKRNEKIEVAFTAIPKLRLQGLTDEEIDEIKEEFEYEIPDSVIINKDKRQKVNMSPIQTHKRMEDYFEI